MARVCLTCRSYAVHEAECRNSPPVPVAVNDDIDGYKVVYGWPSVNKGDWCAKFKQKRCTDDEEVTSVDRNESIHIPV